MRKEQKEKLLELYSDNLKEYREYTNTLYDSRAEGIKHKLDALREVLDILGIEYKHIINDVAKWAIFSTY